jgi:hypothetical protein
MLTIEQTDLPQKKFQNRAQEINQWKKTAEKIRKKGSYKKTPDTGKKNRIFNPAPK